MRVRGSRLQWALSGAFCGVVAGLLFGALFHAHGAVLVVATVVASIFLAWKFVQMSDDWRSN